MKLFIILGGLFFSIHSISYFKPMDNNLEISKKHDTEQLFCSNYTAYTMNIQAAGIANIPMASLTKDGHLYIEYVYSSGSEKRSGKMNLQRKKEHRFEGNWHTKADNGNSYQGSLYFVFDNDGTAKGKYQYAGSSYNITIDPIK